MTIDRIAPVPLAKLAAVFYGFGGLIQAVVDFISSRTKPETHPIGPASIIFQPFVWGFFAFAVAWLLAGLYNVLARNVGGIEIETS